MNHTPGPWKAVGTFIGTDEEDSQTIAYTSDARNRRLWSDAEELANAKLIAAAPELLWKLKELAVLVEEYDPSYKVLKEAYDLIDRIESSTSVE